MAHLLRLLVSLGDIKPSGFSLSFFIIFLRIKGLDSCLYFYCQSNYASNSGWQVVSFFPEASFDKYLFIGAETKKAYCKYNMDRVTKMFPYSSIFVDHKGRFLSSLFVKWHAFYILL